MDLSLTTWCHEATAIVGYLLCFTSDSSALTIAVVDAKKKVT